MVLAGAGLLVGIIGPAIAYVVIRGRVAPGGPSVALVLVIAGVVAVGVSIALWLALRAASRTAAALLGRRRTLVGGVPASATVVSITDTGLTVNKDPQIRLVLDIAANDGGTRRVVVLALISRVEVGRYTPGAVVDVLVDPRDPGRVELAV